MKREAKAPTTPPLMRRRQSTGFFADGVETPIRKAIHGDSSGVRGAAWLWPLS